MKSIITILLVMLSFNSFADGHEPWRIPEYKPLNQRYAEEALRKEYRMLQGIQRELRDTGRVTPKTSTDIYNLRQGYGYDGGYNYQQHPGYYNYGY